MLAAVQHPALRINRPENAAVILINKMTGHKLIGVSGVVKKSFIAKQRIGLRKEPQYAAVQYASFFRQTVGREIIADKAVKPSVILVSHCSPEGNDLIIKIVQKKFIGNNHVASCLLVVCDLAYNSIIYQALENVKY